MGGEKVKGRKGRAGEEARKKADRMRVKREQVDVEERKGEKDNED